MRQHENDDDGDVVPATIYTEQDRFGCVHLSMGKTDEDGRCLSPRCAFISRHGVELHTDDDCMTWRLAWVDDYEYVSYVDPPKNATRNVDGKIVDLKDVRFDPFYAAANWVAFGTFP